MSQKKAMKLWQMVIILVLAAGILATMFLPAYRVDGNAVVSMLQKAEKKVTDDKDFGALGSLVDDLVGQFLDDQKESFDEKIKEFEEDKEIKISSVTPFEIMTHNAQSFFGTEEDEGAKGEDEDKDKENDKKADDDKEEDKSLASRLEKFYTLVRVLLWMVYGLALAVMALAILGVVLKLSKYLPLAVIAAYSVGAMIVFGIGKFLSPSILADNISKAEGLFDSGIFAEADKVFGTGLRQAVLADWITGRMFSDFVGIGFLIGFIFAVILLAVSVISMFAGSQPEAVSAPRAQGMPGNQVTPGYQGMPGQSQPQQPQQPQIQGQPQQPQRQRQQPQQPQRQRQQPQQPQIQGQPQQPQIQGQPQQPAQWTQQPQWQAPPANAGMGKVACTKGAAQGKCFSLPEDRKVVVGRNERNANLVVDDPKVSNVHCSIRYKAVTNTYIVKDHSTNGTSANGIRLKKDVAEEFPAGTVLRLADGANEITLG